MHVPVSARYLGAKGVCGAMRWMPGLWRWRPNPLRRRSDVIEAWASLVTAVLVAVGGPAVGIATGRTVGAGMDRTVAAERAERHQVTATVVSASVRPDPVSDTEAAHGQGPVRTALVRWTALDGSARTGRVRLGERRAAGDPLTVWIDAHGALTDRPLDAAAAAANAIAAGLGSGAATAALACGARQLLGWRLLRRRLADWERAWAQAGEDWGRADAGG